MGTDKLNIALNTKNDTSVNVVGIKPAAKAIKPMLVKITAEEIKARRISAYQYLLP